MRPVHRTLISAGFPALLILVPAVLAAQQRYACSADKLRTDNDIRMTHTGDHNDERIVETMSQRRGHCVNVALIGLVRLRDDLGAIAEMAPGSRAVFHEITTASDRRLEVERAGDGLVHRYRVDGRPAPFDAAAERWQAALLLDLALRSGHGADTRVASLRARGGTDAVLREIATLESDEARRHYYRALLEATPALAPRDVARVLTRALDDIRSNSTRRSLLIEAMRDGRTITPALLEHAMDRISSDGDRRAVLLHALRHGDRSLIAAAVGAAGSIRSDGDKSSVLLAAARSHLGRDDRALHRGFFSTARTIRSDGDLRRVLVTAVRGAPSESVASEVVASTSEIASDGDKASVLIAVAGTGLVARSSTLRRAYAAAAATIRSSDDRARALRAVSQ